MTIALDILMFVGGAALVVIVLDSALRTFVLPRGVSTMLTRGIFQALRALQRHGTRVEVVRGA